MKNKITVRNIWIFSVAVLVSGWVGRGLDALLGNSSSESLGMLLWILTPLLACILLRLFAGDGWKDFGIKPNFKGNLSGYVISVLVFPVVTVLILIVGKVSGVTSFSGFLSGRTIVFLKVFALGLLPGFLKNIFEEFGWRGYLTPKISSLDVNDFIGHLIVGTVWALWHIPYYLFFLDRVIINNYTTLSLGAFIPLALLSIVAYAFVFGEIRLLTNSIWPAVLMHMVEDALVNPLLIEDFVVIKPGLDFFFSPGVSILVIIFFIATGIALRRLRRAKT
jgi:membrane protease YdiL (CAAX protease family)